jgi:hypothetical protein
MHICAYEAPAVGDRGGSNDSAAALAGGSAAAARLPRTLPALRARLAAVEPTARGFTAGAAAVAAVTSASAVASFASSNCLSSAAAAACTAPEAEAEAEATLSEVVKAWAARWALSARSLERPAAYLAQRPNGQKERERESEAEREER